ncbi:hypothetical protein BSKO_00658 [Bryopsis sp. KO-2023]|nr:hypothetical protein BSKO_00658 [Bryopsis sp. KO-2023]
MLTTAPKYFGAILLSRGLDQVALVKPDGCPAWCFPIGAKDYEIGKQAAVSVVFNQTGLQIASDLDDEFVEAEFPEGTGQYARLYIAHSLGAKTLKPLRDAQVMEAKWLPLSDVVDLPDDTCPQTHPVFPFAKGLKEFLARRHELRLGSADPEMGKILVYNKDRWMGPLPSTALKTWLQESRHPAPSFNTFDTHGPTPAFIPSAIAKNPLRFATCTLPHLGVQITPEACYRDDDQAIENAALATLFYLEDGVDQFTPRIDVTACGFFPPPKIGWNEEDEWFHSMEKEATALAGGRSHYMGNEAVLDPAGYHRAKKHKSKAAQPGSKNEIQLIKELCDAARWMQPTYEYERRGVGTFVCSISLARAGIESLEGPPRGTQKLAKLATAQACLGKLKQDGYFPAQPQTEGQGYS